MPHVSQQTTHLLVKFFHGRQLLIGLPKVVTINQQVQGTSERHLCNTERGDSHGEVMLLPETEHRFLKAKLLPSPRHAPMET
jgi:hypothetical protein